MLVRTLVMTASDDGEARRDGAAFEDFVSPLYSGSWEPFILLRYTHSLEGHTSIGKTEQWCLHMVDGTRRMTILSDFQPHPPFAVCATPADRHI